MARRSDFHISLTERDLIDWLEEKIKSRGVSPSLVFRDTIKELKKEDDLMYLGNPHSLHEKIKLLQEKLTEMGELIEKIEEKYPHLKNFIGDFIENYKKEPAPKKEEIETIEKPDKITIEKNQDLNDTKLSKGDREKLGELKK